MKFTEEQIEAHKRFISVAEIKEIARRHKRSWQSLRNALTGVWHYDTGDDSRQRMISEAIELIRNRATKALEVVKGDN